MKEEPQIDCSSYGEYGEPKRFKVRFYGETYKEDLKDKASFTWRCKMATRIYLSLGSNLGDRAAKIASGIAALGAAGIRVLRQSSLYETEPVDFFTQNWFLNNVVEAETQLLPQRLLQELQRIELTLGSLKQIRRGPRRLDMDILFYGNSVIRTAELEVPHPRLADRRFVLVPLAELAPELSHPVLHRTVAELLAGTKDTSRVRLAEE